MTSLVRVEPRAELERERARSWVELMAPAVELAKAIAATEFVPRGMRHNAAAISAAILYGDEVGLGPMQSLAKIAVIDGRPTLAAEAQRALVYAAGHDLWLDEATSTRVTWAGRRAGTDNVTRVTWTLDNARTAGLVGKPNWRAYPRQMLSARASAELVRAIFADVVGGLAATEELEGDESSGVADRDSAADDSGTRRRRRRPVRAAAASTAPGLTGESGDSTRADDLPPLPGETGEVELMSDAQRRRMMALFGELGYRGNTAEVRAQRLAVSADVVGRPLESSRELTTVEADRVIAWLEAERAQRADDETTVAELVDENRDSDGEAGS